MFQQAVSNCKRVSLNLPKCFSGATKGFNSLGQRKIVTEPQQFMELISSDVRERAM